MICATLINCRFITENRIQAALGGNVGDVPYWNHDRFTRCKIASNAKLWSRMVIYRFFDIALSCLILDHRFDSMSLLLIGLVNYLSFCDGKNPLITIAISRASTGRQPKKIGAYVPFI